MFYKSKAPETFKNSQTFKQLKEQTMVNDVNVTANVPVYTEKSGELYEN